MFTIFFIGYQFKQYREEWLNLSEGEGLYTGLTFLIIDFFVGILAMLIYSYFKYN